MPPRSRRRQFTPVAIDPSVQEKRNRIQEQLVLANEALDRAKLIADELGETFSFLDRTYYPKVEKTVITGGDWDGNEWSGSSC